VEVEAVTAGVVAAAEEAVAVGVGVTVIARPVYRAGAAISDTTPAHTIRLGPKTSG
jgi:hypothetical protein